MRVFAADKINGLKFEPVMFFGSLGNLLATE
jgi:hypothetical protein